MSDSRPNPNDLLAEVRRQETRARRGRLKVFFGMAAGVGKTYAMLEDARRRAAEGLDVVVGYAEPHIRPDTEALLLGLDILPYKLVPYRGATLKEFDLEAALARKPALLCVDELAHSNAPGMRHEKRWQDVAELLDAGIDVYTTLNVQHLESVNDVVERITGVCVRETLPDSVLDQADEVRLVDIAPEGLLERFREGRVYRPEQAERASRHFFTVGNLIALRELALRTTAQRVDEQMLDYRRENAVGTTWAASERVLVCVSPSPMSARVVRSARRLAAALRASWVAAYVETSASVRLAETDRRRVEQTLAMAEQLGAKVITLRGEDVADEIVAYCRSQNVTKIVVGKPRQSRWREFLRGSAVDGLIRRSGEIDVHVIQGDTDESEPTPMYADRPPRRRGAGALWAAAVVALVTLVCYPIFHYLTNGKLSNVNVLMVYLVGVLWVASRFGREAAVAASVLAVAAFDYCFVPPYLTFAVSDQQYVVTFAVMLSTALLIATLTDRVRRQAAAARRGEQRSLMLLALARELAASRSTADVAAVTRKHAADALGGRIALLLPTADHRLMPADSGAIDEKELGVAQWAFDHAEVAGAGTGTLPAAAGIYFPMHGSRGAAGVIGVYPAEGSPPPTIEQRHTAEALAAQAAVAVERAALADEARAAWERVEAEFLRNTLLSGVSHELRTPLASITGSVTALLEAGPGLSDDARHDLLLTLRAEAERMERLINNLLDMTRLEAGGLHIKREWQPVQELVSAALRQLDARLKLHQVEMHIPPDLPMAFVDPLAMEQVLINLLDNAAEYTPAGSRIDIAAGLAGDGGLWIRVDDNGPGLPAGTEKRVFEKFFRAGESRRGIGLGLAIARGIVEAHGGSIAARNRDGGGASFQISLPSAGIPPTTPEAE